MDARQLYDQYMITSMVAGFEPIVVKSASRCTYTAEDGRQYLDCFSGIAVTNAGHGHPKVTAAAKKQIDELVHCCTYVYYSPRAGELCKVLAEITPGRLQKSFLGNSGAEAIEGAMRIAKQFTKRKEMVALSASFHGRTVGTLSITGNKGRKKGSGPYLSGVAFAPTPYCYRCPFRLKPDSCGLACAHAMKDVLQFQTAGDVAAFIAEPVMGEGGIIVPPADYFKVAVDILRQGGVLVMFPEGTRSKTGALQPGHQGVAVIAMHSGAPVVPVGISGSHLILQWPAILRRPRLVVSVGVPFYITPPSGPADRRRALVESTEEMMLRLAALLPEKQRGVYAASARD